MGVPSAEKISPSRAWVLAARPKTLPAAVAPVIVGSALAWADGAFALLPALAALLTALLLQIAANLANDYADFVRGADAAGRQGPLRAAASGLLSPDALRRGAALVIAAAVLPGLYLVARGGWPLLAAGAAAILATLAYTSGPWPYGYHGLGDLMVFLFFGVMGVGGTYYVQAGAISAETLWAAAAVGALVTDILVVNNLRDIETDRAAGKRTLAVFLGAAGTRVEFLLLLGLAYAVPLWLWLSHRREAWVLLPLLTLPLAFSLVSALYGPPEGRRLNATLAGTARLSLLYALLFALGLVI